MNEVVQIQQRPKSILLTMASLYGMEPEAFEATLRATCSPSGRDGVKNLTREEFAAFLLVAKQYDLNPLTKEIYAYPKKGGGIVPVVSVDGWINLINSHPQCDGWDMTAQMDGTALVSYTCSMFRKDRSHPVIVTEYLSECIRDTEPWKMKHRMLRHKTLIQTGRYSFGFSGIYDEDEAERIVEARDVTPRRAAPPPPVATIAPETATVEPAPTRRAPPPPPATRVTIEVGEIQSRFATALANAESEDDANDAYIAVVGPHEDGLADSEREEFLQMLRNRVAELEP